MQYISSADVKSVKESLKAKMITQGLNVERFEKKLSTFFGSKYSLAVSSGTAALHLSMLALKFEKRR